MGEAERAELERLLAGHLDRQDLRGAATAAIRGYGPEIFGYLHTLLATDEDAWDVFAAFSEKLWRSLGGFRREGSLRGWAYRIAWSVALDHLKARRRRRERRLYTSEAARLAAEVRDSTSSKRRTRAEDRLARLRAGLDAEEQTLLTLRLDRGFSWEEIAAVLSEGDPVTAPALRKRYERLRARIARELAAAE